MFKYSDNRAWVDYIQIYTGIREYTAVDICNEESKTKVTKY